MTPMRFIPTKTHAILDYATSALLLVSPSLFGFSGSAAAMKKAPTDERLPASHVA